MQDNLVSQAEQRFRNLMDYSPLAMAIYDKSGYPVSVNRAFEKLWGLSLEQLKAQNLNLLEEPLLDILNIRREVEDVFFRGRVFEFPLLQYDPSQSQLKDVQFEENKRYAHGYFLPVKDQNGDVQEVILIQNEVTEQIHHERNLAQEKERFRIAAECASDLIYEWDILNNQITWHGDIDSMLGYASGEISKDRGSLYKIIHPDDKLRVREAVGRQLYDNEPYFQEYRVRRKDGSYIYLTDKATAIRDENGKAIRWIGVNTNITARKNAEKQMQKANAELTRLNHIRSEFTSLVSHELRTPLAVIKESINMVLDGIDGPITNGQTDTLTMARSNVDRLARLIQNVLDFTKMEAGKLQMYFECVNMNHLVQEVYDFMKIATEKNKICFEIFLPEDEIRCVCDPDKIKQVLINLLDNAIKFTHEGGHIKIRLSLLGDEVAIDIEDNGVGIRKQDQIKIFEMFEQSGVGKMKKSGGVGVGLAVCKKFMELHQGKITLVSLYGKGSKFFLTFPANLKVSD